MKCKKTSVNVEHEYCPKKKDLSQKCKKGREKWMRIYNIYF